MQVQTQIKFPFLPESLKQHYGIQDLWLRPFGSQAQDLQLHFAQWPRPYLITQLLRHCSQPPSIAEAFYWDLTITQRRAALLELLFLSCSKQMLISLLCYHPTCQQQVEVAFTVEDFMPSWQMAEEKNAVEINCDQGILCLRSPRGADQKAWLHQSFADEATAVRCMLKSLKTEDTTLPDEAIDVLSQEEIERISQHLETMDPLQSFRFQAVCPACGHTTMQEIDLEARALQALQALQNSILYDTHRLAQHYHWSETEIFALPAWRRRQYLTWIEQKL